MFAENKETKRAPDRFVVVVVFVVAVVMLAYFAYEWYRKMIVEVVPSETLILHPAQSSTMILRNKSRLDSVFYKVHGLPPTLRCNHPNGEIGSKQSVELKIWYNSSSPLDAKSHVTIMFGKKKSDAESLSGFLERVKRSDVEAKKLTTIVVAVVLDLQSRQMTQQMVGG